ncbi:hypothetical protein [Streptomyces sp. NRRL F-5527]|uniref:hypothetical protein n=1 Tax=Streptomyces sp. NRRL F-5527 TaxID=1463862 RepID=UPI0004C4EEAE|nr:hypothetical protein [Streptomyces sp. NRRL F-5527]
MTATPEPTLRPAPVAGPEQADSRALWRHRSYLLYVAGEATSVVFDGGRIAESGTHQELMALGGEYAAMFTLQAGGYRTEAGEAA